MKKIIISQVDTNNFQNTLHTKYTYAHVCLLHMKILSKIIMKINYTDFILYKYQVLCYFPESSKLFIIRQ